MKYFTRLLLATTMTFLGACEAPPKHTTLEKSQSPATTTDPAASEVSLTSDRSQFDQLRKDIPADVRRENDELAFIRELMSNVDEDPQKVRDRFSKVIRDKREKFDKNANKKREAYSKHERFNREAFLKKLKGEREEFIARKKLDSERRKEFFDEQEAQRQDYFSDEHESRKDFESTDQDLRKNFEAFVTEKTNQFNQEMRDYTTAYYERQKQLDLKKRAAEKAKELTKSNPKSEPSGPSPADPDLQEFEKIPKAPGTQLGTPGN